MRLNLIDRWLHIAEILQVDEAVRVEIRYADGAELAGPVRLFHRAIRAIIIGERLMNQQQVDVIRLELLERGIDRGRRLFLSSIRNQTFVVRKISSRGMPLFLTAAPTPSSFPYACAVSMLR